MTSAIQKEKTKTRISGEQKKVVLLDVHAIIHRAYHALPDFSSAKGEPTGALYGLCTMLLKIAGELSPDYVVACYDLPEKTHRHEVYEAYKGTRKKIDDALIAQIIRSRDIFTAFNIPIYACPGFEADDVLGTIAEHLKKGDATVGDDKKVDVNVSVIIASGDMDTLQLVDDKKVQVYTLRKGIKDTVLYDEEAVCERFGFAPILLPDFKGLRGDPSDNIIGIKGIGEKTATTLITTFGSIEKMYEALAKGDASFKEAGITPRIIDLLRAGKEEAMFSKTLATIRRDAPIDFSLPEQTWKESLSQNGSHIAILSALFAELDFRSMMGRVEEVLLGKKPLKQSSLLGVDNESGLGAAGAAEGVGVSAGTVALPPHEQKLLSLALWIIDSNISNPTTEDILRFAHTDSLVVAQKMIFSELEKRGLLKVFKEIEEPLIAVIDGMQTRGIKVDTKYLKTLSQEYHARLKDLEKNIYKEAGGEFNINSPKQMGEILFDKLGLSVKGQKKTAGGAKSTRESELEKMIDIHPIIKHILTYRMLQKLVSTYIDTLPTMLAEDGRLHTTFEQTGTTTGRMSSNNPNLQNIPIKTEEGRRIRNAFVSERGFKLVTFDYSQIELRIAAFLSGDQKLIEIFTSGGDIHEAVASQVFGVPREKVDREMRRRAKVINFGILYGMGVNALRANLSEGVAKGSEVSREEAQRFFDEYFNTFTGLAQYLENVKASAKKTGYTETFFGRRRYFPQIKSKLPYIVAANERMAINAPIQGTAADVIKLSMIHIHDYIKKEGLENDVFLLLQVHDELVFEIREDAVKKVLPELERIMQSVLTPTQMRGVPLKVNGKLGDNWGETEEIK